LAIIDRYVKTLYRLIYESYTAALVKAVQERQVIIEKDKIKISSVEEKVMQPESRLKAMEEKL
jgi:hypothetical protein